MMNYKSVVQEIKSLNWESLEPAELQRLMLISYASAREFAAALRIACKSNPDDDQLNEMAAGELQTTNLSFDGYNKRGDHADFLGHFIEVNALKGDEILEEYTAAYHETCAQMDDRTRAMTIFSREEELSKIFSRILQAKDWSAPGLAAFKYYLERHIQLDTSEGGHHSLTKKFPIDDRIEPFYSARLHMYRALPKLFESCSTLS